MPEGISPSDYGSVSADNQLLSVVLATVPSSPSFAGSSAVSSVSSGGTTHPFSAVTLSDPGTNATETLAVSIAGGTLSGTGFTQASPGNYVATGTVAQINADLAAATFTDTFLTSTNSPSKPDYVTLRDTGSVNGVSSTGSAFLAGVVNVQASYVSNPQPSFSSTQSTVTLVSGQTANPFTGLTLSDTNPSGFVPSETLTAIVTGGTFSGTGFTQAAAGTYVATGTAAEINADLAAATFIDTRASGTATDTISLSDTATIRATNGFSTRPALTTVSVNVTQPVPSSPSFTSASASSTISSGGTTHPFSAVTLVDPGTNATETLTVSFGTGTLSGTGFTQAAAGTYVATGTVAQINADLAGATFTDTFFTSTNAPTKTDYITLRDTGSVNGVPSTGSASLTDLVSVKAQFVSNPQPSLSSTQSTVTLVSGQTDHPLAGVTLSDTNPSGFVPSETLTAIVTGGTFSGTGFTQTAAGTYVATGTAAEINADLAAASFTDTRASGTATDTISLSDTATIAATNGRSTRPALTTVSIDVTQPASAPCYASGTLILTDRGEIVVEALVKGDLVVTASGTLRPVRWLGHRRVDCARHPNPKSVCPIRVRAHAFGPGVPRRDLVLSPEHALFLDGMLVPVSTLVDGVSIVQELWERVTYHHVELDSHDILLAEGLAAESYLDTGNRAQFANNPLVALHASFESGTAPTEPYAPLLINGPRLEALREALHRRANACAA